MTLADTLHGPVRPGRWRAPDPTQTLPQVHRTPSPSTESKVAGRSTSCRRADWTEPLAARNLLLGPQGLGSQVVMSDALPGDELDVRPDPSGSGWGRPAGSGPVGRFAPAKLRRSCCCAPSRRRRSRAGARGPGPHTYGPAGRPRDYSFDATIERIMERADERDLRAEHRDRLAEDRDSAADLRGDGGEEAHIDRGSAARDRELSARDRERAARDRKALRSAYKLARRPSGTATSEQNPERPRGSDDDAQRETDA